MGNYFDLLSSQGKGKQTHSLAKAVQQGLQANKITHHFPFVYEKNISDLLFMQERLKCNSQL